MKFVQQYGQIWKLSEKAYKTFLKQIDAGDDYDLDKLGKLVVPQYENALEMRADRRAAREEGED